MSTRRDGLLVRSDAKVEVGVKNDLAKILIMHLLLWEVMLLLTGRSLAVFSSFFFFFSFTSFRGLYLFDLNALVFLL